MPEDTGWLWSFAPFHRTSWVPGVVISPYFSVRIRRPSIEKMRSVTGPVPRTVYEIAVSGLNGFGEADARIGAELRAVRTVTDLTPRSGAVPEEVWTSPATMMFAVVLFGAPLNRSRTHDSAKVIM